MTNEYGDDIYIEESERKKFPIVTASLIAINVIIFLIAEFAGNTENGAYMLSLGAMYPSNILHGEVWRIFAAMFLHFGFQHLINNMVMLGASGKILEEELGHIKFAIIYLFSGICGGILSFVIMILKFDYAIAAGASGAIFGITGGLLWIVVKNKGHFQTMSTRNVLIMIALIIGYGTFTEGVDNWGHIGGLIGGFLMTLLLYHPKTSSDQIS